MSKRDQCQPRISSGTSINGGTVTFVTQNDSLLFDFGVPFIIVPKYFQMPIYMYACMCYLELSKRKAWVAKLDHNDCKSRRYSLVVASLVGQTESDRTLSTQLAGDRPVSDQGVLRFLRLSRIVRLGKLTKFASFLRALFKQNPDVDWSAVRCG